MKRKTPASRKPVLPSCARHRLPYELRGGKPACRSCDQEAQAAALCGPAATTA